MTNQPPPSTQSRTSGASPASLHSAFNAAELPPPPDDPEQLALLRRQHAALRLSQATPELRQELLEKLYARGMAATKALLATLTASALAIPIAKSTRQQVRSVQQLLRALADDYQLAPDMSSVQAEPGPLPGDALWRSLYALSQHLLLSCLVAAPGAVGLWRQLHQLYANARAYGLTDYAAAGTSASVEDVYFSAILLGCAQPASFTSPEIAFIAAYLARHVGEIELTDESAASTPAAFWIDPTRDAAAFACTRKTAPPQTQVHHFSCARLAARLTQQISELERGRPAAQLGLPKLADTPGGRAIMRRLALYWGEPSKRRFPRRRQNYRAQMCTGLGRLWHLFQDGETPPGETSNWMITNESPDGYAFMHVSGKIGGLSVGDVVAIRTESGTSWQVCIVRWALSENQEHLELGLQILATRAQPARLALAAKDNDPTLLSVLILPAIGALRTSEMLIIPTSALKRLPAKLILVVEKGNVELREVKCHSLEEQNSRIAILAIEPDPLPR